MIFFFSLDVYVLILDIFGGIMYAVAHACDKGQRRAAENLPQLCFLSSSLCQ